MNPEFASLSNLVGERNAEQLGLDSEATALHCPVNKIFLNENENLGWNMIRDWVLDEERQTATRLLKAFVRTHLYRPLFFNSSDFNTFTSDKRAYWCRTEKSFVKHDITEHRLVLDPETWEVL